MKLNFVIEIRKDGKRRAYADTIPGSNEILNYISNIGNVNAVWFFSSRKEAEYTANIWNEAIKHNGNYLDEV